MAENRTKQLLGRQLCSPSHHHRDRGGECSNQCSQVHNTLFVTLIIVNIQVSHELRSLLWESVPYVKIYRYNPKHLYPKLNGYGDNGKRSLKVWQLLHTY